MSRGGVRWLGLWCVVWALGAVGCTQDATQTPSEGAGAGGFDDDFFGGNAKEDSLEGRPATFRGDLVFKAAQNEPSNRGGFTLDAQAYAWEFTLDHGATSVTLSTQGSQVPCELFVYSRQVGQEAWGERLTPGKGLKADSTPTQTGIEYGLDQKTEYRVVVSASKEGQEGAFALDAACQGRGCPWGVRELDEATPQGLLSFESLGLRLMQTLEFDGADVFGGQRAHSLDVVLYQGAELTLETVPYANNAASPDTVIYVFERPLWGDFTDEHHRALVYTQKSDDVAPGALGSKVVIKHDRQQATAYHIVVKQYRESDSGVFDLLANCAGRGCPLKGALGARAALHAEPHFGQVAGATFDEEIFAHVWEFGLKPEASFSMTFNGLKDARVWLYSRLATEEYWGEGLEIDASEVGRSTFNETQKREFRVVVESAGNKDTRNFTVAARCEGVGCPTSTLHDVKGLVWIEQGDFLRTDEEGGFVIDEYRTLDLESHAKVLTEDHQAHGWLVSPPENLAATPFVGSQGGADAVVYVFARDSSRREGSWTLLSRNDDTGGADTMWFPLHRQIGQPHNQYLILIKDFSAESRGKFELFMD